MNTRPIDQEITARILAACEALEACPSPTISTWAGQLPLIHADPTPHAHRMDNAIRRARDDVNRELGGNPTNPLALERARDALGALWAVLS